MKYYSKDHEWVEVKGNVLTVGISKHAADELGDITFVELPKVGATLKAGDTLGVVESVKAASDVYAPVGGKVTAVNQTIEDNPALVNESAEDKAWFCRLEGFDEAAVTKLMTPEAYAEYLAK